MPNAGETDVGSKPTKQEAQRLAAWMHKGGWNTRIAREPDGQWHVYTTGTNDRYRGND